MCTLLFMLISLLTCRRLIKISQLFTSNQLFPLRKFCSLILFLRSIGFWKPFRSTSCAVLLQHYYKLHKRETFVGSDIEFFTFFAFNMVKYSSFVRKKNIWPLSRKTQSFRAYRVYAELSQAYTQYDQNRVKVKLSAWNWVKLTLSMRRTELSLYSVGVELS